MAMRMAVISVLSSEADFDLAAAGSLLIKPVPELEVLRANFRRRRNLELAAGAEVAVDERGYRRGSLNVATYESTS